MEIPIVDFSVYELGNTNVSDDKFRKLSEELRRAFQEVGFVYLRNTGICQEEVCYLLSSICDILRVGGCLLFTLLSVL